VRYLLSVSAVGSLIEEAAPLDLVLPDQFIDHTRGQSSSRNQQYITINPPAGMSRQASSQFAADVARQLRMADARNN
jgi:purine nucleoside phosphorylase